MFYAEEIVEEVRSANDIVDVISGYTTLKQKGSNYFGLCPFHNENTPSFSVSIDKQLYYCFGCGASGNVYSFIMQKENHDFVDAIKFLAERVHFDLPTRANLSQEMIKRSEIKNTLIEIHTIAAKFYYSILLSEEGARATAYLDNRNISQGARTKFGLGYSSSQKSLFNHLLSLGYDIETILLSGLVIENKKGGYFDRFNNRLMFPIFNVQGKIVGFGGRLLDKGEPKYLNSPDTPIFDKSKNLYSINFARQANSKEIIVVEGYMDVISLYQSGIYNVVASLGTAFNNEHAKVLKRYCESTILLFDSDDAGQKAVLRAIPVLLANGIAPKVLQLQGAKDPDEYVMKFGKASFLNEASNAISYIAFQIKCMQNKYDLDDSLQKVQFTNEVAKLLSELPNAIEQDVYIKDASQMTGVSIEAIRQEVDKLTDKSLALVSESKYKNKPNFMPKKHEDKSIDEAKRNIMRIICSNVNIANEIRKYLDAEEFVEDFYIKLYNIIYDMFERKKSAYPAEIISCFEELEDQQRASNIFAVKSDYTSDEAIIKAVNDQIKVLKLAYINGQIAIVEDLSELQKLIESKKNIKQSYITSLDGKNT